MYWIFATPYIIFTYVFNNIWGFWKNIWLNIELSSGQYKPLIWFGLRLMIVPLILDIIFTIPILLFSWDNVVFIFVYYFSTTLYLMLLSFFWSLKTPVRINKKLKGRSTSTIGAFVGIFGIGLLSTIQKSYWLYAFIPFFIIIGILAILFSIDMYKTKKYNIAKKLMSE